MIAGHETIDCSPTRSRMVTRRELSQFQRRLSVIFVLCRMQVKRDGRRYRLIAPRSQWQTVSQKNQPCPWAREALPSQSTPDLLGITQLVVSVGRISTERDSFCNEPPSLALPPQSEARIMLSVATRTRVIAHTNA
jgi:hypothetical protein